MRPEEKPAPCYMVRASCVMRSAATPVFRRHRQRGNPSLTLSGHISVRPLRLAEGTGPQKKRRREGATHAAREASPTHTECRPERHARKPASCRARRRSVPTRERSLSPAMDRAACRRAYVTPASRRQGYVPLRSDWHHGSPYARRPRPTPSRPACPAPRTDGRHRDRHGRHAW